MTPTIPPTDLEEVLTRAEDLFSRLRHTAFFVTGGTGFFGKWLIASLCHANRRLNLGLAITLLSRDPDAFRRAMPSLGPAPEITWLQGDIRQLPRVIQPHDWIIHAATAASAQLNQDNPEEMHDTISRGMENMLGLCRPGQTQGLLMTSSGAVNGPQPPTLQTMGEDEMQPTTCLTSAYGRGKRTAEAMAIDTGLPVRIARGFAFVGPHMSFDTHFAAGNFIRDACAGKEITIKGDGTPLRSYLYAADLVVWLLKILLDGKTGRPYNVGSDISVSIEQLARLIGDLAGNNEVVVQCKPGGTPPERYVPSIERARTELNLEVWTPLPEALQRTINWYRAALVRSCPPASQ